MNHDTRLRHFRVARDEDDIAWLTLVDADNSVNRLHPAVLEELNHILDRLQANPCRAMVLQSGRQPHFIAGADVHGFSRLDTPESLQALIRSGWELANRIASLPWPSLALVQGQCLGGGLELALACTWLVAVDHPDTRFALPEVMLGIVPAWGGILRLPRAVGAPAALNLMLSGRQIDARRARQMGLCHALVPPRLGTHAARQIILGKVAAHRKLSTLSRLSNTLSLRPFIAAMARRSLAQKDPFGHYPAPRRIIDLWQHHRGNVLRDPDTLAMLQNNPVTRHLLRVFALQERLRAMGRQGETNEKIRHVHVIGAGVMGGDIAAWCALRGVHTTLQDTSVERLGAAVKRASGLFRKRLDNLAAARALDRLVADPRGDGVRHADIVIEAITENEQVKREVYSAVLPRMRSDAILATNTSSFTLVQLSRDISQPERLVGLHFFNPVASMPLVEVATDSFTDQAAAMRAIRFTHQLGKLPLPVRSRPGFLVNAALAPYLAEAMRCIDEGISRDVIDVSLRAFGMPMGPLELVDTVGLDVARDAGAMLQGWETPVCLSRHLDRNELGRKSGRGFYEWQDGKAVKPRRFPPPDQALAQRIITPLLDQAATLAQDVVEDADLADAGLIFGAGFPPFLGGPLHYRNSGN